MSFPPDSSFSSPLLASSHVTEVWATRPCFVDLIEHDGSVHVLNGDLYNVLVVFGLMATLLLLIFAVLLVGIGVTSLCTAASDAVLV